MFTKDLHRPALHGLLALVGVAGAAASASAAVFNGSFEAGDVGIGVPIPAWMSVDTPDVVPPGGLAVDNPPGELNPDFVHALGAPASPDGGQFIVLRNSPFEGLVEALSQPLDGLRIGATYQVSFHQSCVGSKDFRPGMPDQVGPGHFEVSLGNDVQLSPTVDFVAFGKQTWHAVDLLFQAGEASQTLTIRAAGFIGGGAENNGRLAIDGVRLRLLGDLNDDGAVTGADLGILLGAWGSCEGCAADLNGDGVVDGADLGGLLGAWTG